MGAALDRWDRRVGGVIAGVLVALGVTLTALGRRAWCKCGRPDPLSWAVQSSHNSQHLLDAYSFTHFQHGLVFFGALWLARRWVGGPGRFAAAVALEAAWEVLENTPMVIDRYRAGTVSLDYVGDSVANSFADVACCAAGFAVASRLPARATVALFVVLELALLATIRDSLLLNVLMLTWPIAAVRQWQAGG